MPMPKSRTASWALSPPPQGRVSPWNPERSRNHEARQRKHESVLRAAAIAFATRGVEGTSMDDLAAALGVTKPTIYRTVVDKDAVVRACEERMNQRFRDALAESRGVKGSGVQKIAHYLRRSLDLMVGDMFGRLILPLSNFDMYSAAASATREMREEAEEQFRTWLRDDLSAGVLRADVDPKFAALALFATFNFIARWYRPNGPMSLDAVFDANFRLFLHGLVSSDDRAPRPARPWRRRVGQVRRKRIYT